MQKAVLQVHQVQMVKAELLEPTVKVQNQEQVDLQVQ